MSDLVELKPCPFCNSAPNPVPQNGDVLPGGNGYFQTIWCERCDAEGGKRKTEADAIEAWNRRYPDPELSRLSALVAEWEKAAEPFVAVAQNDIGECEADADFFRPIGIKYARVKLLTVGDFRRLSKLKDTTNADK